MDKTGQMVPQEISRTLFCAVSSVSASEFLAAGAAGLKPEYRITIFAPDYAGETIAELDGVRYTVYRTYRGRDETLELYVERRMGSE